MKINKDKIQKFVYEHSELFSALLFLVFGFIGLITKHTELGMIGFMLMLQDISIMRVYDTCYGRAYYSEGCKKNRFSSHQECSPKYCKALFKHAHFNIHRVPKVAVQQMYVSAFTAVLFDGLLLLVLITGADRVLIAGLAVLYAVVFLTIGLFYMIKVEIIKFFN